MTSHSPYRMAARAVLAAGLATFLAGAASAAEPQGRGAVPVAQAASPAAAPATSPVAARPASVAVQPAALHACSQRADLLFVRKCLQGCMIDSKTSTRVMQQSREREECQLRCGHQPEMAAFLQACVERAGRTVPAPRAAP